MCFYFSSCLGSIPIPILRKREALPFRDEVVFGLESKELFDVGTGDWCLSTFP
jgi:hypothetical protein